MSCPWGFDCRTLFVGYQNHRNGPFFRCENSFGVGRFFFLKSELFRCGKVQKGLIQLFNFYYHTISTISIHGRAVSSYTCNLCLILRAHRADLSRAEPNRVVQKLSDENGNRNPAKTELLLHEHYGG